MLGIELTSFKYFVKKPRQTFWVFMNCFCHVFEISQIKKKKKKIIKEIINILIKHALVNNNKESIIESRVMRLS